MVYSASMIWAEFKYNSKYYYLVRQALFLALGFVIFIFVKNVDYHFYLKWANLIFFICLGLLIIVLIPGIGVIRGGAQSWIGVGTFGIQPSEFAKVGIAIFISKYLSKYHDDIKKFKDLLVMVLIILIFFGLIMLEPDFGTGIIIVLAMFLLLFVAGIKTKYIIIACVLGVVGITALILTAGYRIERITAFLDPFSDPLGSGFQAIQSLYALVPGGFFGYGLFRSRQKYYFLPEPQTDFIFAILVEELGVFGGMILIFLFGYLLYLCLKIALKTNDLFGKFITLAFTLLLLVQISVNLCVVLGIIPVTGVTLPLLSYGGSSLLITYFMLGIILNVGKNDLKNI